MDINERAQQIRSSLKNAQTIRELCEKFRDWALRHDIPTNWSRRRVRGWELDSYLMPPTSDRTGLKHHHLVITTEGELACYVGRFDLTILDDAAVAAEWELPRIEERIAAYVAATGYEWEG